MSEPLKKDLVAQGLANLLHQWKDKEKVIGVIQSILETAQVAEDQRWQLLTERGIYEAVGEQLDILGRLVGELREGRDDDKYRAAILARSVIDSCDGTPDGVMSAVSVISGYDAVKLWEHQPAMSITLTGGVVDNTTATTVELLNPVGVRGLLAVDDQGGSMVFGEASATTSRLKVDGDDFLVTDEPANITLSGVTGEFEDTTYFLPEQDDPESINYFADIVSDSQYRILSGYIKTNEDDYIALDDGGRLRYQVLEEIT